MAKADEPTSHDLGISPMYEMAIVLHEMFKSLVASGFNEEQALRLTALMAKNGQAEDE
jgi:hypothetical protein